MKEKRKYYFSVEGETEKLYLKRLQSIINNTLESQYNVDLYSKIEKDPCSYVKQLSIINKTKVTHIIDKESEIPSHKEEFKKNLDRMKEAEKLKKIEYQLAYSNFTFELWIILHRSDCFNSLNDRKEYLSHINKVYNKNFQSLKDYKKEENLKKILDELNIDDVKNAVKRAKSITEKNSQEKKEKKEEYRGYIFYNENPSLSIHEIIEQILKDCKLI